MSSTTHLDRSRLVFPAMILAVSMSFIDQTIVAIASPTLQRDLHLTATQGQWAVNAYTVALAATFALGGKLADTIGRRRMALIGVVGFAICSALCGATPAGAHAETWLIGARAAQGAFAAMLMPAAITTVYATASAERRGRSMAAFFGIAGAFTALGPVVGSYLLNWSWRAIFWVNIPVAIAAVVLILMADIPPNRLRQRIDWLGAVLIAAAMGSSVIGFTQSASWGWESPATWACLAAGVVLLGAFVAGRASRRAPARRPADLLLPGLPGRLRLALLRDGGVRARLLLPEHVRRHLPGPGRQWCEHPAADLLRGLPHRRPARRPDLRRPRREADDPARLPGRRRRARVVGQPGHQPPGRLGPPAPDRGRRRRHRPAHRTRRAPTRSAGPGARRTARSPA